MVNDEGKVLLVQEIGMPKRKIIDLTAILLETCEN